MLASLNPQLAQWTDKKIWIIGASSGIGAALAKALLAKGADVAISARTQTSLVNVASAHPKAFVLPFDATEPEQWSAARAKLAEHWSGSAYWVIFCAATYRPEHVWDVQAEWTRQTLQTNLGSVYFGVQTCLGDLLAKRSGGFVIVASVAGYVGLPRAAVYGPTKAALINLAQLMYVELHGRGLGVYLVNPGFVKTRLTERNDFTMPALQTPEQAANAILKGMAKGEFEISFPKRFTWWLKLLQLLPYRMQFAILARTLKS